MSGRYNLRSGSKRKTLTQTAKPTKPSSNNEIQLSALKSLIKKQVKCEIDIELDDIIEIANEHVEDAFNRKLSNTAEKSSE